MIRSPYVLVAILSVLPGLAGAVEIEGRKDLPPCLPRAPVVQDCHITGPDMAINMMGNRPSRQLQPNAYSEFVQYERERERESHGRQ